MCVCNPNISLDQEVGRGDNFLKQLLLVVVFISLVKGSQLSNKDFAPNFYM